MTDENLEPMTADNLTEEQAVRLRNDVVNDPNATCRYTNMVCRDVDHAFNMAHLFSSEFVLEAKRRIVVAITVRREDADEHQDKMNRIHMQRREVRNKP